MRCGAAKPGSRCQTTGRHPQWVDDLAARFSALGIDPPPAAHPGQDTPRRPRSLRLFSHALPRSAPRTWAEGLLQHGAGAGPPAQAAGSCGPVPPGVRTRLAQVIDLKAARQKPDRYRTALARRGAADDFDELLAADQRWREPTERAESLRARAEEVVQGPPPPARKSSRPWPAAQGPVRGRGRAGRGGAGQRHGADHTKDPNLPDPTAADGMDKDDAVEVATWGEPPLFSFPVRRRTPSSARRGAGSTWPAGARLSGSRFATGSATSPYRAGAVPVRAGPAAAAGFPHRAAAGARRRARDVRHRVPADRGVQPLPGGAGRAVPDRHLGGGAGRLHRTRSWRRAELPLRYAGYSHELPPRGGRGGPGHPGHLPGAPVRQGRDVRLHAPEQSRETHEELLSTKRRSSSAWDCPTGS